MNGVETLTRHVREMDKQAAADLDLLDRLASPHVFKDGRDNRGNRDTLRTKRLRPPERPGRRRDSRDSGELRPHFELLERDGSTREAGVYWVDIARDGGGEVTG